MQRLSHDSVHNRLLSLLPLEQFTLLQPHLEPVDLPVPRVLIEEQQPIEYAYFLERGIASVVSDDGHKAQIEIGIYGREGMGGTALLMGSDRIPHRHFMQISGAGLRIPSHALLDAIEARDRKSVV